LLSRQIFHVIATFLLSSFIEKRATNVLIINLVRILMMRGVPISKESNGDGNLQGNVKEKMDVQVLVTGYWSFV
jgi:hypothetical protein